jgi:guanine nucleotide-binding protein G(i) subunit alpha
MNCCTRDGYSCILMDKKDKMVGTVYIKIRVENMETVTITSTNKKMKVIMLGTGSSGKSTLLKQIRLLREVGFEEKMKSDMKYICLSNVLQMLKSVLQYAKKQKIPIDFPDPASELVANEIRQWDYVSSNQVYARLNYESIQKIQDMWNNCPSLKKILSEYHYEIQSCPVESGDLLPRLKDIYTYSMATNEIVLKTRIKTTGIIESMFHWDDWDITFVDTGGQRNERRKWNTIFSNYDQICNRCVIFTVNLAEYCCVCYEDDSANRTQESLSVFEKYANIQWFERCPIFLVFTHRDLFQKTLRLKDMSQAFPNLPVELCHVPSDPFLHRPCNPAIFEEYEVAANNDHMDYPLNLFALSDDVVSTILCYLTPKELGVISLVSRQMSAIANSDAVWFHLCRKFEPDLDVNEVVTQFHFTANYIFKSYFRSGGKAYRKNLQFMQDEFLKLVKNEQQREYTRKQLTTVNCLDCTETHCELTKIIDCIKASAEVRSPFELTRKPSSGEILIKFQE